MSEEQKKTGLEVAVIGMAGRFPRAADVGEFWENLKNGVECTSFFSREELEEVGVSPELLDNENYVRFNGMLEGMAYFDASFFGYTPKEAELMDPQVRIFHECVWEALENAGIVPGSYDGTIGLYGGSAFNGRWMGRAYTRSQSGIEDYEVGTLNERDFLCTRVSYKLNLDGPSLTVQTACSTSLVAIHLACQGLLSGECNVALAGGVSVMHLKKGGYFYQEGMVNSPDGHLRAFDADARGAVFSDGAGVVALKMLEDALADGDYIYAVVKGSAINNDGSRKVSFTSPGVKGQAAALRAAYEVAEVEPESIGYIETHGTGTMMGDPVEIKGLTLAFDSEEKQFCAIGSVKANIGHLNSAAGVAGFIKTVLALYHRQIPPSINFKEPNPQIDFENTPFYVNGELSEWKDRGFPLRAAVSSFGIGGTNAHVVLEETPRRYQRNTSQPGVMEEFPLILLSGRSQTALNQAAGNLGKYLEQQRDVDLRDVSFTLQKGRKGFEYRGVTARATMKDAVEVLTSAGSEESSFATGRAQETGRPVVFMFSGQGSQYVNMGRDLYDRDEFYRGEVDHCFELLEKITGTQLKKYLYPGAWKGDAGEAELAEAAEQLNSPFYSGPFKFVFEYSLARSLMERGIKPYALIGHSFGEYAAACLAGVFGLEDALRLAVLRGRFLHQTREGAMMSVPLGEEAIKPFLEKDNLHNDVSLAAVNTDALCIVSGVPGAVEALEKELNAAGHECLRLNIERAGHSKLMECVAENFEAEVAKLTLNEPKIPYISCVSGSWIGVDEAASPNYWKRHMLETVRFYDGISTLIKDWNPVFLQVGCDRGLPLFVNRHPGVIALSGGGEMGGLNLVRHKKETIDDVRYYLEAVGNLWLWGVDMDWDAFYGEREGRRLPLPSYPFERSRFWIDERSVQRGPLGEGASGGAQRGKKSSIKDWFYVPHWQPTALPPVGVLGEAEKGVHWLVLMDAFDASVPSFFQDLLEQLTGASESVTVVSGGEGFWYRNDDPAGVAHGYIDPAKRGDYLLLLEKLAAEKRFPTKILYLRALDTEALGMDFDSGDALERGFYGLLWLAQAIGERGLEGDGAGKVDEVAEKKLEIIVLTRRMHAVDSREQPEPSQAVVLGPLRSIPLEYPHVRCRGIDTDVSFTPHESDTREPLTAVEHRLLQRLLAELYMESAEPLQLVSYRNGRRFVLLYEAAPIEKTPGLWVPYLLKKEGVYFFTGGLGGMALELAAFIASSVEGARIVLVSRTALRPREEWDEWQGELPFMDKRNQRINGIKRMEALGAEVWLYSAEVDDYDGMAEVVADVEEKHGRISGVFHCAGGLGQGLMQLKKKEQAAEVFVPKVEGTQVLDILFRDRGLDFMVLCSSVSSVAAGIGQVDYCAANAFLDAYAHYRTAQNGSFTVSINWDAWQQVGMAAELALPEMRETGHRLLDYGLPMIDGKDFFMTHFQLDKFWVLNEHMAPGRRGILPGTAYLEMACAAAWELGKKGMVTLREVQFLAPLMTVDNEVRETLLEIEEAGDGYVFEVRSKRVMESVWEISDSSGGGSWQKHAAGHLITERDSAGEGETALIDLEAIKARCPDIRDLDSKEEGSEEEGMVYFGPRWRNWKKVWFGTNEGLLLLELEEPYAWETKGYRMHPALLDTATAFLNTYINPGSAYIPLSYKALRWKRPLPSRIYSHSRFVENSETASGEMLTFNVTIMDEKGEVCVEVEEFSMLEVSTGVLDRIEGQPQTHHQPNVEISNGSDSFKHRTSPNAVHIGGPGGAAPLRSPRRGPRRAPGGPPEAPMGSDIDPLLRFRPAYLSVAIKPEEGVEVLRRVMEQAFPQVVVSTIDFSLRLAAPESEERVGKEAAVDAVEAGKSGPRSARPDMETPFAAAETDTEKTIAGIWQRQLGLRRVGMDDDFFELGGDSLKAISVTGLIHKETDTRVPLSEFFERPTVRLLAELVADSTAKEIFSAITQAEEMDYYRLSSAQKRLYILQQLEGDSLSYNLPEVLALVGDVEVERLEKTFKQLIRRHESFRTSFTMINGEPVQCIHEDVVFEMETYDLTEEADAKMPPAALRGPLRGERQGAAPPGPPIALRAQSLERPDGTEGDLQFPESVGDGANGDSSEINLSVASRTAGMENIPGLEKVLTGFLRPFDLSRAPLLRAALIKTGSGQFLLMIDVHHIVYDGTSMIVLFREFMPLYQGKTLPEPRLRYRDYSQWQNSRDKGDLAKQEAFWKKEFSGPAPVLNLPLDFPRPAMHSYEGNVYKLELGAVETDGLRKLAASEDATLFMTLLSVYMVFLGRLCGQEDIVVGSPVAGRQHPDIQDIIGMFLNTLALRQFPEGKRAFRDFLREVKNRTVAAFDNQDYPFEELVEQVAVNRDLSRNPLFDAMFILHNEVPLPSAGEQAKRGAGESGVMLAASGYEKNISMFDLTLNSFEGEDHLLLKLEYCAKLFKPETVARFAGYFHRLVQSVLRDADVTIDCLEMVGEEEKRELLETFNQTELTYQSEKTIHELFEDVVSRCPSAVAVKGPASKEDMEKGSIISWTYERLNEEAESLAQRLIEKGAGRGVIVGIMVRRSPYLLAGLLGILKTGAAYLPLDPEYPANRIDYILKNSETELLLTEEAFIPLAKNHLANLVLINGSGSAKPAASPKAAQYGGQGGASPLRSPRRGPRRAPGGPPEAQTAYVIYTSGSTGNPKGVVIGHGNAVNFIAGMTDCIDFEEGKTILALTTVSFDIFFLETLLPLTCGMTVAVADEAAQKDPTLLKGLIKDFGIDMLQVTPSRLQLLLALKDNLESISGIKELMVGGEAFPANLFRQVKEFFKGRIYNMYGPTETTIWSAVMDLTDVEPEGLTIGRPIGNTQVYIVNREFLLQPVGVAGELLIGGDGVGKGYLNNEPLTAEKFIKAAEVGFLREPGEKCLYRTGDLARWLGWGELEFLGRLDHQVKIRGFRIELDEIEEQLTNHSGIKEAVVTARENERKEKFLCAYYVPADKWSESAGIEVSVLRDHLSVTLPEYMIPSFFLPLESFPLTPNGKIDRRALPERGEMAAPVGTATYMAPNNEVEQKIAAIWQEELKIEKIGIDDNFFELGGSSLDIVRVHGRLKEVFDKDITVVSLFQHRTVAALAAFLAQEETKPEAKDRTRALERGEKLKAKRSQMRGRGRR